MKRCPKCNRTYLTDTQRFCTQDGVSLVTVQLPEGASQGDTIRIDSSQLNQFDEDKTKAISRDLVPEKEEFDPFKTVVARPEGTTIIPTQRDTQDLSGSAPTSTPLPPRPSAPPPPQPTVVHPPVSSRTEIEPGSGKFEASPAASDTGPLTPPSALPTSAPLVPPAAPQSPSTSAPLPQPPAAATAVPSVAPQQKRSKLPLILGILIVLLLIGVGGAAVAYIFVVKPMLEKQTRVTQLEPAPAPTIAPTPKTESTPVNGKNAKEPPPYSPPADAVEFVNSSADLDGKLKEHYVDFSFYYPESWEKDPKSGVAGANNFVEVHRQLPPNFTEESFAVSWYESAGSFEKDQQSFHSLADSKSAQFAQSIDQYHKVSDGPTKVGPYDAYEFRFEGISQKTDKGQFKIWGRVVWVPPSDGGPNGVTLLMLGTSLAQELKNVNDVGEKGDLPMILQSFRLGKHP